MTLPNSKLSKLCPGDTIPGMVKQLSQEKINLYAEAVGDFNPIHVDESFAAQSPFGGTIAHGMLVLAYLSEMITLAFGENWLSGGKLAVRFKVPARSKDTIIATGKINSITEEENSLDFSCSVSCHNQNREVIVAGEARIKIPLDS